MNLLGNIFKKTFLFIVLAELLSLFAYLLPDFRQTAFLIIVLTTLILTLYKLEYGIWVLLAELFIGSKGYLFFFEHNGLIVSIRIALWLIVISVWLGMVITNRVKNRTKAKEPGSESSEPGSFARSSFFKHSPYFSYFLILFAFITWGLINGFLNHNEFSNIFFDFNGWLYFVLVFPIYSVITDKVPRAFMGLSEPLLVIWQIFIAAIIWLSLKTFFLLFAFSHNMIGMISELYYWVRTTGVGEITQIQGGFYRIFFQSHIFVLIGFFIFIIFLSQKNTNFKSRKYLYLFSAFCFLLSAILISFSRSFWLGLITGFILLYTYFIWQKYSWKKILYNTGLFLLGTIVSIGLIAVIVKFPYPKPMGGFNTTELISQRASTITGEAGVSSRWALLPELWQKIKNAPILGQGFGTTVTYKTGDPRVLQSSPTGEYTTYAFEWGWLDIWLKLGLLGLFFYLILIAKICLMGLMTKQSQKDVTILKDTPKLNNIKTGLIIGLIIIAIVSIFSPYMNHPLGIGYLLMASLIINFSSRLA